MDNAAPPGASGNLAQVSFPEVLAGLHGARSSGTLMCTRGSSSRSVQVRQGTPSWVAAGDPDDSFAAFLFRGGFTGFDEAFSDGAVAAGEKLDEARARGLAEEHATELLLDLFSWTEGEYCFLPATMAEPEPGPGIGLALPAILARGIERVTRLEVLREGAGAVDEVFEAVGSGEAETVRALSEETCLVLGAIRLGSGIDSEADLAWPSDFRTLQCLWELRLLGLVQPAAGDGVPLGALLVGHRQPVAPSPGARPPASARKAPREPAPRRSKVVKAGSIEYPIEPLTPAPPALPLQQPREVATESPAAHSLAVASLIDFTEPAAFESVLAPVHETAMEQEAPPAAEAARPKPAAPPVVVSAHTEPFAQPVASAATEPQPVPDLELGELDEDLFVEPPLAAAPPPLVAPPVAPPVAPRIPPRMNAAARLAAATAPAPAANPENSGSRSKPPTVTELDSKELPAAKVVVRPPQEVALDWFKNGERFLREMDLHNAVTSFREAVRLSPDNADYLARLGTALARNPKWRKEGEEALLRAIELKPWAAKHHVALARLYTEAGVLKRAEARLKAAIEAEPGSAQAQRDLQEVQKKIATKKTSDSSIIARLARKGPAATTADASAESLEEEAVEV
jgi:hypothetical protein